MDIFKVFGDILGGVGGIFGGLGNVAVGTILGMAGASIAWTVGWPIVKWFLKQTKSLEWFETEVCKGVNSIGYTARDFVVKNVGSKDAQKDMKEWADGMVEKMRNALEDGINGKRY